MCQVLGYSPRSQQCGISIYPQLPPHPASMSTLWKQRLSSWFCRPGNNKIWLWLTKSYQDGQETLKFPRRRGRGKRYRRQMLWEHRARALNLVLGIKTGFLEEEFSKLRLVGPIGLKQVRRGVASLRRPWKAAGKGTDLKKAAAGPAGLGPEREAVLTLLAMARRCRTGDWRVTEKEEVRLYADCVTALPPLALGSVSLGKSLSLLRASVFLYKTGFTIHTNGKFF